MQFTPDELHGDRCGPQGFHRISVRQIGPHHQRDGICSRFAAPRRILDLAELVPALSRAERALGELSGIGRTLPSPYLLIRPLMRREAVSSSKIEGTVTTLSQLFLFELDRDTQGVPSDANEVWNYVRALEHCLAQLQKLPVTGRLIKEAHRILLTGVQSHRGARIIPGEYRTDQNWIGAGSIENARFVPPPPNMVADAMSDLEKYINEPDKDLPILIRLALIHYQFEAIHPFPDGNGRVGRLLIPIILRAQNEISEPLLYMSPFFEARYEDYIDEMLYVSRLGLWGSWIKFFLEGVEETCRDAVKKVSALQDLQAQFRDKVQQARSSALLGRLIDLLFEHPAISVPYVAKRLGITYNAAKHNVERLVQRQILRPGGEQYRPKYFFADEVMGILN